MSHPNCHSCGVNGPYAKDFNTTCANCGKPYFAPKEQPRTFPIVYDTWTEYERGWGSRPDGMSLHLNAADHKAFVADFDARYNNAPTAPDEYTKADHKTKVVEVPESLYEQLKVLRAQGVCGLFVTSREAEKMVLAGKDPFVVEASKLYDVVMTNVDGRPLHPKGRGVPRNQADKLVNDLEGVGIKAGIVERGKTT
jgi:hypothetical protein